MTFFLFVTTVYGLLQGVVLADGIEYGELGQKFLYKPSRRLVEFGLGVAQQADNPL